MKFLGWIILCALLIALAHAGAGPGPKPIYKARAMLIWRHETLFSDDWQAKVIYIADIPNYFPTLCFKLASQLRHIQCFYINVDGDVRVVDTRNYDEEET